MTVLDTLLILRSGLINIEVLNQSRGTSQVPCNYNLILYSWGHNTHNTQDKQWDMWATKSKLLKPAAQHTVYRSSSGHTYCRLHLQPNIHLQWDTYKQRERKAHCNTLFPIWVWDRDSSNESDNDVWEEMHTGTKQQRRWKLRQQQRRPKCCWLWTPCWLCLCEEMTLRPSPCYL